MDKELFNIEVLEAWKDIDPNRWQQLVLEIIQIFFDTAPQQYSSMRMAYAQKDFINMKKLAHSLKSSCGNVGAQSSFLLLSAIENISESETTQMRELFQKIDPIFAQTLERLTIYKNQL